MDTLVNEATGGQAVPRSPSELEGNWDYSLGLPDPPTPLSTPDSTPDSPISTLWWVLLPKVLRSHFQGSKKTLGSAGYLGRISIKLAPPVCRALSSQGPAKKLQWTGPFSSGDSVPGRQAVRWALFFPGRGCGSHQFAVNPRWASARGTKIPQLLTLKTI